MNKIPYDASRTSLYKPGEADDFFQFGIDLTDNANLCAEMSRLAYVKEESRLKNYLHRAGFELVHTVGYQDTGTQLFIARTKPNTTDTKLVVAFRGTEGDDWKDILADAFLFKKPWFDASGKSLGKVHSGFAKALLNDRCSGNILAKLETQLDGLASEFSSILLTGHSLGAALATLTASYFNQAPISEKIHAYTFGSPRVGNCYFSKQINSIKHDRYVNCSDLVTCIPSEGLYFQHVGTQHYIDRYGVVQNSFSENDIATDRKQAVSEYSIAFSKLREDVWLRRFADHCPINYLSGVAGIRV